MSAVNARDRCKSFRVRKSYVTIGQAFAGPLSVSFASLQALVQPS